MSLRDTIKKRISTNKFTHEWVNPEKLIELLDIAVYAPNHKMRQPWRFIILEGEGKKHFLENYLQLFQSNEKEEQQTMLSKVMSAPAVVAVVMTRNPVYEDELEDLQACAALIQNFLLLLEDSKMASFWKTPAYISSEKFKEVLKVNHHEIVAGLVMVGYPAVITQPKPRKSAKELTTIYQ